MSTVTRVRNLPQPPRYWYRTQPEYAGLFVIYEVEQPIAYAVSETAARFIAQACTWYHRLVVAGLELINTLTSPVQNPRAN